MQFAELWDDAANACRQKLIESGATNVRVWGDGALRVVVSNNPIPTGWQFLASVSRNGKPVSAMEAMQVASRFVPTSLRVQNVDRMEHSMAVWFESKGGEGNGYSVKF